MISLNPENLTILEKIQSSLLVFCLDDDSPHVTPEDYSQVFNYLVLLFLFFLKNLFIFWPCWVFVALHRLSFQLWQAGCTLVAVCGLLIALASLVVEHRL